MKTNLGQLIRAARLKKGLSQVDLADQIGVSQAAIGQWERGEFVPRGKNLNALVDVLGPGVDPQQLDSGPDLGVESVDLPTEQGDNDAALEHKRRLRSAEHSSKSREFDGTLTKLLSQHEPTLRTNLHINAPIGRSWIVDLLTHRSVIEIKHPNSHDQAESQVIHQLWRLVVLRSFLGPGRNYIAVVRRPPTIVEEYGSGDAFAALAFYDQKLAMLSAEANLAGIELVVADTAEEAAKAIEEIESHPSRSK